MPVEDAEVYEDLGLFARPEVGAGRLRLPIPLQRLLITAEPLIEGGLVDEEDALPPRRPGVAAMGAGDC
jgi:hypothetical protein